MQVNKLRSSCYAAAVGVLLSIGGTPAFAQSDNRVKHVCAQWSHRWLSHCGNIKGR